MVGTHARACRDADALQGNSWLLIRRLGYQGAYALFASGRHLSGAEAHELGLVNELVDHGDLLDTARAWCERIDELPDHVARMGGSAAGTGGPSRERS